MPHPRLFLARHCIAAMTARRPISTLACDIGRSYVKQGTEIAEFS